MSGRLRRAVQLRTTYSHPDSVVRSITGSGTVARSRTDSGTVTRSIKERGTVASHVQSARYSRFARTVVQAHGGPVVRSITGSGTVARSRPDSGTVARSIKERGTAASHVQLCRRTEGLSCVRSPGAVQSRGRGQIAVQSRGRSKSAVQPLRTYSCAGARRAVFDHRRSITGSGTVARSIKERGTVARHVQLCRRTEGLSCVRSPGAVQSRGRSKSAVQPLRTYSYSCRRSRPDSGTVARSIKESRGTYSSAGARRACRAFDHGSGTVARSRPDSGTVARSIKERGTVARHVQLCRRTEGLSCVRSPGAVQSRGRGQIAVQSRGRSKSAVQSRGTYSCAGARRACRAFDHRERYSRAVEAR
ncbi:unnamed protein product, partial [Iphiclides podalirius]